MLPGYPWWAAEIPAFVRHRLGDWWLLMRWRDVWTIPMIWVWRWPKVHFSHIFLVGSHVNSTYHDISSYPEISWHLDILWFLHSLTARGSSKLWVPSSGCSSSESIASEAKVCYTMMTRDAFCQYCNTRMINYKSLWQILKEKTVESVTSICFSILKFETGSLWGDLPCEVHHRYTFRWDKSWGLAWWHWPRGIPVPACRLVQDEEAEVIRGYVGET